MKFLGLSFHRWRGFGPAQQGDFFILSYRLGLFSLYACRVCLVERLQQFKALTGEVEKTVEQRARDGDGQP